MATKRTAGSPKRTSKRSRATNHVPTIVDAVADAEALPADFRTLLKLSLPIALSANKADRSPYEAEVVDQAQQALATVQICLEQKHAAAMEKQNAVIAPTEHAARVAKKKEAEAALEAAKSKLESCKEDKAAAQKAVHDTQSVAKAAEKELAAFEKEMQQHADNKATLTDLLANEFAQLNQGTTPGAAGQKAVKKIVAVGNKYKLDDTLLQAFPATCKKAAHQRSEFDQMMFTTLQSGIDRLIENLTQKLVEAEPSKAQKLTAMADAKSALEKAEAALATAAEELNTSHTAHKYATKEVPRADTFLNQIWSDMKLVCDAQDALADELKNFKESIVTAFERLKEKEPEPVPVQEPEPAAEQAVVADPAAEVAAGPALVAAE